MLVVQCIRETKLIIKAKKWQTALNQIVELGHKVGRAGGGVGYFISESLKWLPRNAPFLQEKQQPIVWGIIQLFPEPKESQIVTSFVTPNPHEETQEGDAVAFPLCFAIDVIV